MVRQKTSRALLMSTLLLPLAAARCGAAAQRAGAADTTPAKSTPAGSEAVRYELPPLPNPSLAVPSGNELAFVYRGVGAQVYRCKATNAGAAWVAEPDATLFEQPGRVAGKHFAGPTWQSNDGSEVVAAKVASASVADDAIPWLLLQANAHRGTGRMSGVTYVQRLATNGGTAPPTGCDDGHLGSEARVDYTATYVFYEPKGADGR